MSPRNWPQFNAHHLKHWAGSRNASIHIRRRAISTAWSHLNTGAKKLAEVQAIQRGEARTLAQIIAPAPVPGPGPAPAQATTTPVPPASIPPPAAALAPSQVQTIFESPVSSPRRTSANSPEQHVARAEEHGDSVHRGLLDRDEIMEDFSPEDPARPDLSRWLGGWKIGGRGANKACVWVRFDDQENAVERLVIKDVAPEPPALVDMTRWEGDPRDLVNRVPLEYVIHKRLCQSDGRAFFVDILAHRSLPDKQMYRMILEYCDQDNAEQVANYFDTFTKDSRSSIRPEPFFWRVLEHLVLAATVMEQGNVDSVVEDWKPIVHRDLKADNVFMATDEDCYYPKPLVSDFEFAIQTSESDPWNPRVYREHEVGKNTGAWYCQPLEAVPKEQFKVPAAASALEARRISSPANVWCIGITMFTIMHGWQGRAQIGTQPYHRDLYQVEWNETVADYYSEILVRKISQCLDNDPKYRPTLTELRDLFTRHDLPQNAEKCRDARNARPEGELRDEWRCPGIKDEYAVGLSREDIVGKKIKLRRRMLQDIEESRRLQLESEEQARQEELDAMNDDGVEQHGGVPSMEDEEASEQEGLEAGSAQRNRTLADETDMWGEQPNTVRSTPEGQDINDEEEVKGPDDLDAESASMDISD